MTDTSSQPLPEKTTSTGQHSPKILIIEDDDQLQNSYGKLFTAEGYQVFQATTGAKGIDLARAEKPDVVLLDIMLPGGFNGFDVLEQIKKDRDLFNIPVIMLTNLDTQEQSALSIGAADYLVKANTSIEVLLQKVKFYLGQENQEVPPSLKGLPNHIAGGSNSSSDPQVF